MTTHLSHLQLLGPTVLCAFLVSLLTGAALWLGRRSLDRFDPAALRRLMLAAIFAPPLLSAVFLAGGLIDWRWFSGPSSFCLPDHGSLPPSAVLLGVAGLGLGRLVHALSACLLRGTRLYWTSRALRRSGKALTGRCHLLPIDAPQAFVLGAWRPSIYLTRGLLDRLTPAQLEAILAHEQVHVRRRDSLLRLLAGLGLAFHLPGMAGWLKRRFVHAQELTADAEAAQKLGDRLRLAETLVRVARLKLRPVPTPALDFTGGDLKSRVTALLDDRPRTRGLSASQWVAAALGILALALAAAHPLHWLSERLLTLP
ncbi:MAG: M48 family metalloprotease [Methylothermaceae bacterium]|nr:M48 family metalloprotease [Methylothermaceae bacterium]